MRLLEAQNLAIGYGARVLARDLAFDLEEGTVTCLLGPNGVGKTTLFRTLLGLTPALGGDISLSGQSVRALSRRAFARAVSYVPQAHAQPFAHSVLDLVLMGRTSHLGAFSAPGPKDRAAARRALVALGIEALADADVTRISGGQLQLALIARALAQDARVVVMDEPTASLDLANRARVLAEVRRLAARGIAVLVATHEPDHTFAVADRVAMLARDGRFETGPPAEVMTGPRLSALYGLTLRIEATASGRAVVTPVSASDRPVM